MENIENLPVNVDGHTVGRVIINHNRANAVKAAIAAAYHVSTPTDIQFCTFSDGSCGYGPNYWGGVGLAHTRQWLPEEWAAQSKGTDLDGNTVETVWPYVQSHTVAKAWPFGHAVGSPVMEGVGVLESLYAANEEVKRHLPALTKHSSSVMVKVTTDCQEVLHYIPKETLTPHQAKKLPTLLIDQMRDLMLLLKGHGITVVVELHWCPRNSVPHLLTADQLAGEAMRTGLGYCNVTQNFWTTATQSVVMTHLEPMLVGILRFARLPVSQISPGTGTVTTEKETTKKKTVKKETIKATTKETTNGATKKATKKKTTKETTTKETMTKQTRRSKKDAKRAAQGAEAPSGAASAHPQFPLPSKPLPSKPSSSKPMTTSDSKATGSNDGQATLNAKATTIPPTDPITAPAPQSAQPPKDPAEVQAGKRKAEENMEESKGRPTKTSKPSPDSPTQKRQPTRMPAAWRMDPFTNVYTIDPRTGLFIETPVARAEWIRTNPDSTKVTGETNVFISDGVSPFCLAKPKGIIRQD